MRIAVVLDQFPALSETFILNQITGLIDRGHEVDIFATPPVNGQLVHADVKRYGLLERTFYRPFERASRAVRTLATLGMAAASVCRNPRASLAALSTRRFGRAVRPSRLLLHADLFRRSGRDYDVVHCHYAPNGEIAAMARDLGALSGRIVTSFHGYDVNKLPRSSPCGRYDFLFRRGDLFTANTRFTREQAVALGCPREKTVIHPVGLDVARFLFRPRTRAVNSPIKLLSVARLVEKKGIEYALRAVKVVARAYPNIQYRVAGEGPLRAQLERLARELDVAGIVSFLGWQTQEQLRALYDSSHLFLQPSVTAANGDREGQCLVLQEAQAMGLPVLSTRHNGIPDGVLDGESGFLVPERDVDALAERLVYLLEHPERWPEIGRAGREFVEQRYDINRLNDRLVTRYEELVRGSVGCQPVVGG